MGKCVILTGPVCSGKTTLADHMVAHGYKKIMTYTTRPPRDGEVDGLHYRFVSNGTFDFMRSGGFFAESYLVEKESGVWQYGSPASGYLYDGDSVIILTPSGIRALPSHILDAAKIVLMDIHKETAIQRAEVRGDDIHEVAERFDRESGDFQKLFDDGICSLRIYVEGYHTSDIFDMVNCIADESNSLRNIFLASNENTIKEN